MLAQRNGHHHHHNHKQQEQEPEQERKRRTTTTTTTSTTTTTTSTSTDSFHHPPSLDFSEMRGCLGHVVLLQVAFQRRQLPCTTPSNDVLLCQTRGENTYHDLGRVIGGRSSKPAWMSAQNWDWINGDQITRLEAITRNHNRKHFASGPSILLTCSEY